MTLRHVCRGGAWCHTPHYHRAAYRCFFLKPERATSVSLRLVRTKRRVVRGGSWDTGTLARYLGVRRYDWKATDRFDTGGFRIARKPARA
jgi:formylglycine-generating enzyme required for sulfatase activity